MAGKRPTTRGRAFVAEVTAAFDLNAAEVVLLHEVGATIDVVDALPAADVQEQRAQRTLLARMLSQLALPDSGGGTPRVPTTASQRGSKAARARWDKTRSGS
jgi:hypothetical protein